MKWLVILMVTVAGSPSLAEAFQDPPPDERSRDRLIRKTRGEQDDDVMSRVLDLMADAARRLRREFDTGPATWEMQRQTLRELDLAISQARKNLHKRSVPSSADGDRQSAGQTDGENDSRGDAERSGDHSAEGPASPGDVSAEGLRGGALREQRRQWGNLPPRERQELLQGVNEESHEQYREQIDRYYEALADTLDD